MSDILYTYREKLYVNLTNRCPCACTFCIRSNGDALGSADNLWLDNEPDTREVMAAFAQYDITQYNEVTFCGYGEPLYALDTLTEVSDLLKKTSNIKIRVNTNGLADLIHKKRTAPLLVGYVDVISISLNAPNSRRYEELVRPVFGAESFEAMLRFAADCKQNLPDVRFSVVDVLTAKELEECKELAQGMGIPLRVRPCE